MLTDDDEMVVGFNIDLNSGLGFQEINEESFMSDAASSDQPMHYQDLIQDEGWDNLCLVIYFFSSDLPS